MAASKPVLEWLMDSDPSIRWRVMRDLLDYDEPTWTAERRKVETQGHGAYLLSKQDPSGSWDGGTFFPAGFSREEWQKSGQPWTATAWALTQLRDFGLDPNSKAAKAVVASVKDCKWEEGNQPFWSGETEECINGRTIAAGSYFGLDLGHLVQQIVSESLEDGGWNCERASGSSRSSFHTTINVLEGLLEYERCTGGSAASKAARKSGEEYLLQRSLLYRLSNGELIDEKFLNLHNPNRWRYDILRALEYFRGAAMFDPPEGADKRLAPAVEILRSKRGSDQKWVLDVVLPGRCWFTLDEGVGHPSKWITLRAMSVLRWYDSYANRT